MTTICRYLVFTVLLPSLWSCSPHTLPQNHVYNEDAHAQLWTADWSPDGKFIAVGGVDSIVRIFHAKSLELYRSYPLASWVHVLKWHPEGKILAAATLDRYVQFIDIASDHITSLDNETGPHHNGNGSRAMDWNTDGTLLAVGGLDGVVKVWDEDGNLVSSLDKYPEGTSFTSFYALDWHPKKNAFVVCNFEIQIVSSACEVLKVMEHQNPEAIILCTQWHPSGEFFVVGDYGHNWEGEDVPSLLHFWSKDGKYIKSLPGSMGPYRNINWDPDGTYLASASDVLRIWSKDGTLLRQGAEDGSNYLWGISWDPVGHKIVTSSRHKTVSIWNRKATLISRSDIRK